MFEDAPRVVCMTNMINVVKATNYKNIILTSHADTFRTHRTPYDVAALLSTLGFPKNQALSAMKENCEAVIKAGLHRQFFKGTIKQIPEVVVQKISKKIKKHR